MGVDKAGLEWDGVPLVVRLVTVVGEAARRASEGAPGPVVVVRSPGQSLPPLPEGTEVVEDGVTCRGPLEGLRAGLAALAGRAEVALVAPTDVPLLVPEVLERLHASLHLGVDVAVPQAPDGLQPLVGAYRVALAGLAGELLAAGEARAGLLVERAASVRLAVDDLYGDPAVRAADPRGLALRDVDDTVGLEELGRLAHPDTDG
jgi:molybdopterin-guanine dinucleotide biosynthesis protein A